MKGLLSFGLPFLFKIIIPGIVGAIAVGPLMVSVWIRCGIEGEILDLEPLIVGLLFTGLALFIGFLVYFLEDTVYKVFEGYKWWPKFIRTYLTRRLNTKIGKIKEKADRTDDEVERAMLWELLMMFPIRKEGKEPKPEAELPTMLGNILRSYEEYPKRVYGMSAVFFWPRLWLSVDDVTRKEVKP